LIEDSLEPLDPVISAEAEAAPRKGYWRVTSSGTYGFLAALPLFILYEGFILLVNTDPAAQVRVGADLWTKQLLAAIGGTGLFALGIPVLLIGVFIFIRERKLKLPFRSDWFGWMIGESALYTVVVALLVSTVVGLIFSAAPDLSTNLLIAPVQDGVESLSTSLMFVLSIGAGLYEELVFRVVLVGGMFWVMKSLFKKPAMAYIIAAIVGALIFSAVHYVGAFGDSFTLASFSFRFLFGLVLNGIFLVRGFGIAAWTHAIYDILVVTELLG